MTPTGAPIPTSVIPFRTVQGRWINLAQPQPDDVNVDDISKALSHICRFGGHTPKFYSVAQHACLVADLVAPWHPRLEFPALHHDDSEAYLGDVSRHLKHSTLMDQYRQLEKEWETIINIKLDLLISADDKQIIKVADDLAAIYEHVSLRTDDDWDAHIHIPQFVQQGFVKSDVYALINLSPLLKLKIVTGQLRGTWTPGRARFNYIRRHHDAEPAYRYHQAARRPY